MQKRIRGRRGALHHLCIFGDSILSTSTLIHTLILHQCCLHHSLQGWLLLCHSPAEEPTEAFSLFYREVHLPQFGDLKIPLF